MWPWVGAEQGAGKLRAIRDMKCGKGQIAQENVIGRKRWQVTGQRFVR